MNSSLEVVLTVFHLIIAVTLIGLVLIQDSKSGAMGVLGSGNSNSILGATGATTLASKMTRWTALLFAMSCLTLAVVSSRSDKSVLDGVLSTPTAPVTSPVDPATSPAPTTTPEATPAQPAK